MDERYVYARISRALKLDKNSALVAVDSIVQQIDLRTGITKVRVQIPLRQCQIIMKKFQIMYL